MKVRELKNLLELGADDSQMTPLLKSFSHWVAALFQAKEYVVGNPKDLETLRKLEALKIVELKAAGGRTTAALTKEGRQLYQDFYGHGYYL